MEGCPRARVIKEGVEDTSGTELMRVVRDQSDRQTATIGDNLCCSSGYSSNHKQILFVCRLQKSNEFKCQVLSEKKCAWALAATIYAWASSQAGSRSPESLPSPANYLTVRLANRSTVQ